MNYYIEKNRDYTISMDNIILNIDFSDNYSIYLNYIINNRFKIFIFKTIDNKNMENLQNGSNVTIKLKTINGNKNIKLVPEAYSLLNKYRILINNTNIKIIDEIPLVISQTFTDINIIFEKFTSNIGVIIKW